MSLAAKLAKSSGAARLTRTCRTGVWLDEQPQSEQNAFHDWVAAGNNKLVLLEACQEEGLKVGTSSFYRHLNGKCDCGEAV